MHEKQGTHIRRQQMDNVNYAACLNWLSGNASETNRRTDAWRDLRQMAAVAAQVDVMRLFPRTANDFESRESEGFKKED